MIDRSVARRVGAVAMLVAAAAVAFVLFALDRIEWGSHMRIAVYFHHAGGLREGAPFVVGGKAVGKVEAIALSPRGAPGPLNGDEGIVATVAIESATAREISSGGDVFVSSRGLLSDRYLELGSAPHPGTPFREGEPVLGRDPPSMDRVLQRTWDNLTTAARFFAEVRPEFDALRTQVATLSATLGSLMPDVPGVALLLVDVARLREEANATFASLGGRPGLDRIGALVEHAQRAAHQMRGQLATLGARADALQAAIAVARGRLGSGGDRIVDKISLAIELAKAAIAKVDPLLAQVDALNDRLARGEGSIGKLMHDPEFPEDAKELGKILKRHPWRVIARPHD